MLNFNVICFFLLFVMKVGLVVVGEGRYDIDIYGLGGDR